MSWMMTCPYSLSSNRTRRLSTWAAFFTIEGREDIRDKEPKRLVALKVADVPLESIYKLTDRDGGQGFTKFYRFKNVKLLDEQGPNKGKEKKLSAMENLGLSPLPNGMVRLFSEYKSKDLAYVGGTETKYVPIGDRVEVSVGPDKDITDPSQIERRQDYLLWCGSTLLAGRPVCALL